MSVLINPGSGGIPTSGNGWTNTLKAARKEAREWLRIMASNHIHDVEILPGAKEDAGRWHFRFRHKVTRKVCVLETPGIDNYDAYCAERIFTPRTYWGGSSCGSPSLDDFLTDGFRVAIVPEATP